MDTTKLAVSIFIPQAIGGIAGIFTAPAVKSKWYANLKKPWFQPPSWLFGPVWTFLYFLMGVSLYLVWDTKHVSSEDAIFWFGVQLFLNFCWPLTFFLFRSPKLALVVILLDLAAMVVAIRALDRVNVLAGVLFFPNILWTLFALALNLAIVAKN